jgi:hypothetical protein
MLDFILTSRFFVPSIVVLYGLFLFGVRIITLIGNDVSGDILLASFTCSGAILTWVIDFS